MAIPDWTLETFAEIFFKESYPFFLLNRRAAVNKYDSYSSHALFKAETAMSDLNYAKSRVIAKNYIRVTLCFFSD